MKLKTKLIILILWLLSLYVTWFVTYRYGTSEYYWICKWEDSKDSEWRHWFDEFMDGIVTKFYINETRKERRCTK